MIRRVGCGDVLIVTSALTIAEVLWMRGAPCLTKDKAKLVHEFFRCSYTCVYNKDAAPPPAPLPRERSWGEGIESTSP